MRSRWQDWVIALAIALLGIVGIWSIWGPAIAELVRPGQAAPAAAAPEAGTGPGPKVAPPAGPAQGPF